MWMGNFYGDGMRTVLSVLNVSLSTSENKLLCSINDMRHAQIKTK